MLERALDTKVWRAEQNTNGLLIEKLGSVKKG